MSMGQSAMNREISAVSYKNSGNKAGVLVNFA
jgi:hypothetical protein